MDVNWAGNIRFSTDRVHHPETVAQVGFACFALGFAFALKRFYSQASSDDLGWVLAPTVWLVERITGAGFVAEAHHGYLSRDLRYSIVPGCAGVNFMVVAFCSLACGLMHARRTICAQFLWLLVSGLMAYGATLLANATRNNSLALARRLRRRTGRRLGGW